MTAPTTPIQLRAAWDPVRTEALFSEGSSGEYEASARKRRSAETHSRKPINSFSRRLPVGAKILERKFMMAHYTVVRTISGHSEAVKTRSLLQVPDVRQSDNDYAKNYAVYNENLQTMRLEVSNQPRNCSIAHNRRD